MIPKRIYLDTKDWIYLSQVYYELETDSELVEVYQKIRKLSDSDEAIFPISFSHLEDILIRNDDASRNRLIDVIMEISKGYVLEPYTYHIRDEVRNAVAHRLGKISTRDIKSNILSQGLLHIVSKGMKITWNNDVADIPDEVIQKIKDEANTPEWMAKVLKDSKSISFFQENRNIVDKVAKIMDKNRLEKLKLGKEDRYSKAIVQYLFDIVGPQLDSILETPSKEMIKRVIPQDKESMEKFLEDMPSTNISFRLTYGRDEWYEREVKPNDIADVNHLAVGIAYCDIVVTEKAFGNLAKELRLDKKYGCTVVRSLKELNKII